jgi:hypothetical protein
MKKWFFLTLPVLLLAQQPAGAVPIHYAATLAAGGTTMGLGDFTFDPNSRFTYKFTVNSPLDLSVAAEAQLGNSPTIQSSSVTSMYIMNATKSNFLFQIFQLIPSGPPNVAQVVEYDTQDNNGQTFTSLTGSTVSLNAGGIVTGTLTSSGCNPTDNECLQFLSNALPQSPPFDQACAITQAFICGPIIPTSTVPAPGSLPLFGIGIAGLLYLWRPRRKPEQPMLPAVAV